MSGYFGSRSGVWNEPADRTVFGLLRGHSDAEIAALIAPRTLIIEHGNFPSAGFRLDAQGVPERLNRGAGKRGKPGKLLLPRTEEVESEYKRFAWKGGAFELRTAKRSIANETWMSLLSRFGVEVTGPPAGQGDWALGDRKSVA